MLLLPIQLWEGINYEDIEGYYYRTGTVRYPNIRIFSKDCTSSEALVTVIDGVMGYIRSAY